MERQLPRETQLAYSTHDDNGDKAGRDDDPVPVAIMRRLAHQDAVEDEIPQTELEASSCVCVCV